LISVIRIENGHELNVVKFYKWENVDILQSNSTLIIKSEGDTWELEIYSIHHVMENIQLFYKDKEYYQDYLFNEVIL